MSCFVFNEEIDRSRGFSLKLDFSNDFLRITALRHPAPQVNSQEEVKE
jgi:hypothetical protein